MGRSLMHIGGLARSILVELQLERQLLAASAGRDQEAQLSEELDIQRLFSPVVEVDAEVDAVLADVVEKVVEFAADDVVVVADAVVAMGSVKISEVLHKRKR